jgi:hypothetical protein
MAGCSQVRPDCADDIKKFLQSIKGIRRLADKPVGALACYAEIPLSLAHTERWKIWIKSRRSAHDEMNRFEERLHRRRRQASALTRVLLAEAATTKSSSPPTKFSLGWSG